MHKVEDNDKTHKRSGLVNAFKIACPLLLGGVILWWMYRKEDFTAMGNELLYGMDWWWMLLSLPFGISAQLFRGWRWRQTLTPLGENPRLTMCVHAVFISYASSLVIPRIGEFARCGILKRYDNVSFPKALGTVVTERAVDTLVLIIMTVATLLLQRHVFTVFFNNTGTSLDSVLRGFTITGWIVTVICAVAALWLVHILLKRLYIYNKVKATLGSIWQGVISLKNVKNIPLFILFTLGIWASYFIQYYLTFFCFDFTAHLGITCAMVTFIVGTIAVIVPTPNGAGPWHFAVKTMLVLYGVAEANALCFVLIVHAIHTLLIILLGIYSWMALSFSKRNT